MGCSSGRTVEGDKINNNGYPICRLTFPLQMEVGSLSALDKNKLILGAKEELQCFDILSKSITPISKEHKGRINCIIKLSNGNIATGSQDNTIKIWDIDKKEVLYTLNGHTSIIWEIRELEGNKLMVLFYKYNILTSIIFNINNKIQIISLNVILFIPIFLKFYLLKH